MTKKIRLFPLLACTLLFASSAWASDCHPSSHDAEKAQQIGAELAARTHAAPANGAVAAKQASLIGAQKAIASESAEAHKCCKEGKKACCHKMAGLKINQDSDAAFKAGEHDGARVAMEGGCKNKKR